MIRAILFDCFGTLISTGNGSIDATRQILAKCGSPLDPAAFYADWKRAIARHQDALVEFEPQCAVFERTLAGLFHTHGIQGNAEECVLVMLRSMEDRVPYEDALRALNALKGRYGLYLASTTDDLPLKRNLACHPLPLDGIYTSERLRLYKPQPAFYRCILNDLGLSASEAVFVGDSLADDVKGPQATGLRAIWLNRKSMPLPEGIFPDAQISTLDALESLLERL